MQGGSSEQGLRPDIPAPSNEAHNGSDTNSHVHSLVSSPTCATPVSRNIQPATSLDDQPSGLRMDTTTNQGFFNAQPYIQPAMPCGLDDQSLGLRMDTTTNQDLFNAQPYIQPAMTSGLDIQLDPAQTNEVQDTVHEANWRRKAKVYSLGMRQEFHDNAFESCPPFSQPIIIRA